MKSMSYIDWPAIIILGSIHHKKYLALNMNISSLSFSSLWIHIMIMSCGDYILFVAWFISMNLYLHSYFLHKQDFINESYLKKIVAFLYFFKQLKHTF